MAKKFYFGTRERMAWVKCPAINADLSMNKWATSGTYLNGGGYARTSITGHKVYQFAWNLAKAEDIYAVTDYATGIYGTDLIYFLDPFAVEANVLPSYWSAPRLARDDAPPLIKEQRPTLVATQANNLGYPTQSAVYTLNSSSQSAELFVPVPIGYTFHFGVHGSSTGTARIEIVPEYFSTSDYLAEDPAGSQLYPIPGGLTEGPLPGLYSISGDFTEDPPGSGLYTYVFTGGTEDASMLPPVTTQRTNLALSGVSGVTIRLAGTGILTLAGLIAQVRPDGQGVPTGGFISGRGNSGCRFENAPTMTGYSSPEALDKMGATATLRETGAWE